MARLFLVFFVVFPLMVCGCPHRDEVPESAYDPELVEAAKAAAEDERAAREAAASEQAEAAEEQKGECSRETGGCEKGYVCWDSWFCKNGFEGQCSAAGDKRCHKKCSTNAGCPQDMPFCREIPIFSGSDHGVLEKFCVPTKSKLDK
jgi:hypothetical protein